MGRIIMMNLLKGSSNEVKWFQLMLLYKDFTQLRTYTILFTKI